ncbi:hypothetical protein FCI23_36500 [Actinacidiphila oryziradicis]|uniref:Uncharacterized protein n=1 Tax=Actinacidiphila oryziradicis TaxID=2571141 RepID=A0A4U0S2Y9_9ACTN|nr:hypothetical protein FCI23_36500 [Actinacidiphila oryziradicis]
MRVLQARQGLWARRPVRWTVAFVAGAFWWWAVLRLVLQPGQAGPVEGAVAGWSLSLVPLHSAVRSKAAPVRGPRTPHRLRVPPQSRSLRMPRPRTRSLPGHRHSAVGAEDLAGRER